MIPLISLEAFLRAAEQNHTTASKNCLNTTSQDVWSCLQNETRVRRQLTEAGRNNIRSRKPNWKPSLDELTEVK